MSKIKTHTLKLGEQTIILETGLFGAQAGGAVTARCGDTVVFAAVTAGSRKEGLDYFPLSVEYREKHYAGGVISSSRFIKREGRPSDNEILTCRLIDRSIRPLFHENYFEEVQVVVTPLSIDAVHEPEILGIIAASAALTISDCPFHGPMGAVRVGYKDGKYVVNPTLEERKTLDLDLVISADAKSIVMVEAGALEVTEEVVLGALKFGQEQIAGLIAEINEFAKDVTKENRPVAPIEFDPALVKLVADKVNPEALLGDTNNIAGEGIKIGPIVDMLVGDDEEMDRAQLNTLVDDAVKNYVRMLVLEKNIRFDGRKTDQIREINSQVGMLPRTHGSAFFQRGLTHALSIVTLGSPADEQLIDGMKGEETKRYMHHYNMPPFASGETGRFGNPGRREIGHGALAERALIPVLPTQAEFPYTIRVVSEIMSSNGSTSQASVCGSSLSLMDAGVPIRKPVAGIAMGLVTDGKGKFVTLSDIAGLEDHTGDMDFKVAGTADGITAIQMDVKTLSVTSDVLGGALDQAKRGRIHILGKMAEAIKEPRKSISIYAPKIASTNINPEKIGMLIGPGGKNIRQIQADFDVKVDVTEEGLVSVTGLDETKVNAARDYIGGMTAIPEVGKVYEGTVKRLMTFGAFVEILPGQEGLVHVSRMAQGFVADPATVVKEGDKVSVKVYELDDQGRINLTMLLDDTTEQSKAKGQRKEGGSGGGFGGDRGPRRDFAPRDNNSHADGGAPRRDFSPRPGGGAPRGPRREYKKFDDHR